MLKGILSGAYGVGDERRTVLGISYSALQAEINALFSSSVDELAYKTIAGLYGSGEQRKNILGSRYECVQQKSEFNA